MIIHANVSNNAKKQAPMRVIGSIIICFCSITSYGQITNSYARDKSNIYCHVIDTLVSMILTKEQPDKIVISSDKYILDRLTNAFPNIAIFKSEKLKCKLKFENAIWITIDYLCLDREMVNISTTIRKQMNKYLPSWESGIGSYELIYMYDSEATIGMHRFFTTSGNREEKLTASPRFILIWQEMKGKWKVIRAISYGH